MTDAKQGIHLCFRLLKFGLLRDKLLANAKKIFFCSGRRLGGWTRAVFGRGRTEWAVFTGDVAGGVE